MKKFKFIRQVIYEQVIEVEADNLDEAKGIIGNDDFDWGKEYFVCDDVAQLVDE